MPFDKETVRAKYLSERDRRLVEGRSEIRDLDHDAYFSSYRKDPFTQWADRDPVHDEVDVVIVGGGIAGVVAGANLRKAGVEKIRLVDQAGGVGGTWYWNRYPGVMCDVESYMYIPMLEEFDYVPTKRYAFGDEIRSHLERIAERYRLEDDALFHTGVTRAEWHEDEGRWLITTDRGDEIRCRWYVLAVGILNLMKLPAIAGMEEFDGRSFHSARWDYDYTGGGPSEPLTKLGDKVVALFGTGASGIQCLPPLVESAKHVYVFQRTPSAIGVRGNRPTDPDFAEGLEPGWQRARMDNFQAIMLGLPVDVDEVDDGWTHHFAAVNHPKVVEGMTGADIARSGEQVDFQVMEEHRRRVEELVDDPVKADILKPFYRYICKRPCFHDEYLPAFNAPNVTPDRLPRSASTASPTRGRSSTAQQYEVDCIVYGTGFEPEQTPLYRRAGHEIVGPRRRHAGAEVRRRPAHPVRHDEPRLPQPVRDARPVPAGRGHGQLHAGGRAGRRVRRPGGRAACSKRASTSST